MYFIYIIYSKKFNRNYVGLSADVEERLKTHNSGKVKSTNTFCTWEIIHTEMFETWIEVRKREKYFKSAAGRRWRKLNLGH